MCPSKSCRPGYSEPGPLGTWPCGEIVESSSSLLFQALLRPGRIDRLVYVPLPCASTRREIFEVSLGLLPSAAVLGRPCTWQHASPPAQLQFRKTPVEDDIDMSELVSRTEGFSGAEVSCPLHPSPPHTLTTFAPSHPHTSTGGVCGAEGSTACHEGEHGCGTVVMATSGPCPPHCEATDIALLCKLLCRFPPDLWPLGRPSKLSTTLLASRDPSKL